MIEARWWFRSLHYGHTDPNANAVLWWCVLPDGRVHIAREQWRQGKTIAVLATDMHKQTRDLRIEPPQLRYTVADEKSIGAESGDGEGRAATFRANGIPIRVLTIDPAQGWTRVRELFGQRPDGRPWLTIDPSCVRLVRAMSTAMGADADAEVLAPSKHTPLLNALRTGAMSRPAPAVTVVPPLPPKAIGHLVNEIRSGGAKKSSLAWRS